jgi:nitroimidazol reductase NimA-like FMN-containing flavoprotein (pyridoxamine 5'-phosphate oxidase superfamily)
MDLSEARRTFRDARIAHVGTTLPTGHPHVVPLWFVWLEDAIYASTREGSRLRRNVAADARVAVQIDVGRAWTEQAGVLVQGAAEVLSPDHPAAKGPLSAWFDKYRDDLAGRGFAVYTEQVRRPLLLRVQPDRFSTWIHAAGGGQ